RRHRRRQPCVTAGVAVVRWPPSPRQCLPPEAAHAPYLAAPLADAVGGRPRVFPARRTCPHFLLSGCRAAAAVPARRRPGASAWPAQPLPAARQPLQRQRPRGRRRVERKVLDVPPIPRAADVVPARRPRLRGGDHALPSKRVSQLFTSLAP